MKTKFELDEIINEHIEDLKKEEIPVEQTDDLTPNEWYKMCYDNGYNHLLVLYAENICNDAGQIGLDSYDKILLNLKRRLLFMMDIFCDRHSDVQFVNTCKFYNKVDIKSKLVRFEWPQINYKINDRDVSGILFELHGVSDVVLKVAFNFRKSPVHFLTFCAALSSLSVNKDNETPTFSIYRRKNKTDKHPFIETDMSYGIDHFSKAAQFVPSLKMLRTLTPEYYRKNLEAGVYCHPIVDNYDNYLTNQLSGIIQYNNLIYNNSKEIRNIIMKWLLRNYPLKEFNKMYKELYLSQPTDSLETSSDPLY